MVGQDLPAITSHPGSEARIGLFGVREMLLVLYPRRARHRSAGSGTLIPRGLSNPPIQIKMPIAKTTVTTFITSPSPARTCSPTNLVRRDRGDGSHSRVAFSSPQSMKLRLGP
jgi:hypothetical protein